MPEETIPPGSVPLVPRRIAYFCRYIPGYRHGVFELLSRRDDMAFTFAAGIESRDRTIHCPKSYPFPFRPISYRFVRLPNRENYFSFSHDVLRAMLRMEFEVMILANDILGIDVWLCALLKRFFGLRLILWGQGISRPETFWRIRLRKWLMGLADACVLYGEDAQRKWIERGIRPEKLFVAYNALDTEVQWNWKKALSNEQLDRFRERVGLRNKRVAVFVGRLVAEKRPEFVVRALSKVLKAVPDAHLVLIGDGPERKTLESVIAKEHLEKHCTLTGALYEEEQIAHFLLCSRVAVFPAFAGLAIQHVFGYGVPVVLGDVKDSHGPEAKLVVQGETGLWCPEGDSQAFAEAIKALLANDALHQKLSVNAESVIRSKHNKENMAEGITQAVKYVLNK